MFPPSIHVPNRVFYLCFLFWFFSISIPHYVEFQFLSPQSHTTSIALVEMTTIFLVLLTFPPPTDHWETPPVQIYSISTMISNSTFPLTTPLFHRTTSFRLGLEPSPIIQDPLYVTLWSNPLCLHSVTVILPIFTVLRAPTPLLLDWVYFLLVIP